MASSTATRPGTEDYPVVNVTWYDAIRFANWMNNGQGNGDTETGAYTILGGTPTPSNGDSITRNPARQSMPSENEWYKAAYYDPTTTSYYLYPTSSNTPPTADRSNDCAELRERLSWRPLLSDRCRRLQRHDQPLRIVRHGG